MGHSKLEDIVLIADELKEDAKTPDTAARRDLEQNDRQLLQYLKTTIEGLGHNVHHYAHPSELVENAQKHTGHVVLSIFGGETSRNRMALAPAVCEALGLRYIGPDTYGRIIAQDKEVSKRLAADFGIETPPWRVIRDRSQLDTIAHLVPPLVVKPLLEGSSIGIASDSLQHDHPGARQKAGEILQDFGQPAIVEEFVAGREVAFSRVESDTDELWAFSEVIMKGDENYFLERLFDAEEKLYRDSRRSVRNIDAELSVEDRRKLDNFLQAFGTYGYCRIDGRLRDGVFHFIEMTPDAWLGLSGQFVMGFTEKGFTYSDVIRVILNPAAQAPRARSPSD